MQNHNTPFNTKELFNPDASLMGKQLAAMAYPWEILSDLSERIIAIGQELGPDYMRIREDLFVHQSAKVENAQQIEGAALIGPESIIKANSVLRAGVIIGKGCYVGNFVEIKNSVLYDGVQLPHYNYVGDSILGERAHLGAGAKISNFRSLPGNVNVHIAGRKIDSGLEKLGALLGDHAEIGCNAVLNPGSIIGKNAVVYPLVAWRGHLMDEHIAKNSELIVPRD